jgi:hypothetical protein
MQRSRGCSSTYSVTWHLPNHNEMRQICGVIYSPPCPSLIRGCKPGGSLLNVPNWSLTFSIPIRLHTLLARVLVCNEILYLFAIHIFRDIVGLPF